MLEAGIAMPEASLLTVCAVAGLSVFVVLSFLAGVIHALNLAFPPPAVATGAADPAVVAAITRAVEVARPGSRVTAIEELK
jgi:hypothetical protein